jgi:hypothetical protein
MKKRTYTGSRVCQPLVVHVSVVGDRWAKLTPSSLLGDTGPAFQMASWPFFEKLFQYCFCHDFFSFIFTFQGNEHKQRWFLQMLFTSPHNGSAFAVNPVVGLCSWGQNLRVENMGRAYVSHFVLLQQSTPDWANCKEYISYSSRSKACIWWWSSCCVIPWWKPGGQRTYIEKETTHCQDNTHLGRALVT